MYDEVVGVQVDVVDQVLDEDSTFGGCGFGPDGVEVEVGEQLGDLVEAFGEFVSLAVVGLDGGFLGSEGLDLGGEALFFVGEGVGADLVGVVQIEELLPLGAE